MSTGEERFLNLFAEKLFQKQREPAFKQELSVLGNEWITQMKTLPEETIFSDAEMFSLYEGEREIRATPMRRIIREVYSELVADGYAIPWSVEYFEQQILYTDHFGYSQEAANEFREKVQTLRRSTNQ